MRLWTHCVITPNLGVLYPAAQRMVRLHRARINIMRPPALTCTQRPIKSLTMFSVIYKILLGSALFAGGLCAPTPPSVAALQTQAHGTLPNGQITLTDGSVGADGITNVQLLNFNENFEVAFFTSLVNNITQSVTGFTLDDEKEKTWLLGILQTILAVSIPKELKLLLMPISKKHSTSSASPASSKARTSPPSSPANTSSRPTPSGTPSPSPRSSPAPSSAPCRTSPSTSPRATRS
jgi:hypothetical protein